MALTRGSRMPKRENFTAVRVASFRCEEGCGQSLYWDAKTPGLGVRVTSTGARSYIFQTRLHNKSFRVTIGDVKTWALGDAQAKARQLKAQTDQGIDPRQVEKEAQAQAEVIALNQRRQNLTLGNAWAVYTEARQHKWSDRHLSDHQKLMQAETEKIVRGKLRKLEAAALSSLANVRLAELTPERVGAWLKQEAETRPTQAALAYRLLRAFLNWSQEQPEFAGLASADACTRKISRDYLPKKQAKTDCLQREQLKPWFEHVRRIQNPVIAAYLQAVLLTGARREEMAGLQWADVDFRWLSLTIRDKVDGERTIPLTPFVTSLLATLPRRNAWVFSSPAAESGRLQEPAIAHRRAVANAGLPALSLHGLRRSFGTLCEWVEMPMGIAAQIMGHKPSATAEKHYRQRPLDLLRMWHTKAEGWILEQAGIEFTTETNQGLRVVGK